MKMFGPKPDREQFHFEVGSGATIRDGDRNEMPF